MPRRNSVTGNASSVLGTFPAKITKILYARYKKYGEAGRVELLPLELIEK